MHNFVYSIACHIESVFMKNVQIVRDWSTYASIDQHMPELMNICQYCTVLPERNAGFNACCCFNAASHGLTVPLTVLLCYDIVTSSHLLSTPAPGRGSSTGSTSSTAPGAHGSGASTCSTSRSLVVLGIVEQCSAAQQPTFVLIWRTPCQQTTATLLA